MGILKGLKTIQKHNQDAEQRRESALESRVPYFKISDGQSFKIRFLQELDEDSPNYSEKNDLGFIAVEHSNPANFRLKALCTIEEQGRCVGCEQHRLDWKAGWKPKQRLYINILVMSPGEEPAVKVLSQGLGAKAITESLMEIAGETGSITNRLFKIKRTGAEMMDTAYLLVPSDKDEKKVDVEEFDLFDLNLVVKDLPYEEQVEFYQINTEEPASAETSEKMTW